MGIDPAIVTRADSRLAIERDIETHEQAIARLKRQLNTLTDIACLPTELLAEIFLHVVTDCYENEKRSLVSHYYASRTPSWLPLMRVCHSWREVAFSTPRMWGYIIFHHQRAVDLFLTRSKQAPLSIAASLDAVGSSTKTLLEGICTSDSQRLAELHLIGAASALRDIYQKIGPSAGLKTLVLLCGPNAFGWTTDHEVFPHTLTQQQLPAIRTLELSKLKVGWDNPIFCRTLTNLVYRGCIDHPSSLGTFTSLVSALKSMTALVTLELEDVIPHRSETSLPKIPQNEKIALRQLRQLSLTGRTIDCALLLHQLSLPATVHRKISGRGDPVQGIKHLITTLKDALVRSKPLRIVRLECSYSCKRILRASCTPLRPSADAVGVVPALPHCELWLEDMSPFVSTLVQHTKVFDHVHTLDVHGTRDWKWTEVFTGMPNLVILSLWGDQTRELTKALSAVRRKKGVRPTLYLRSLEVLKLYDVRLASRDYGEEVEFVDALCDALIKRCNYGLPVWELHLEECINVAPDDVASLEEIVPDVHWDGVEGMELTDEEDEDEYDEEDYSEFDEYSDDYYY